MSDKYIRFGDHFLVLGDAEEFVNWLIDESDLSDEEKLKELEYQSTWQIGNDTVFLSAISRLRSPNDWPAVCSQCGHYCYSGEYVEIQVGFNVHTHREVISRSLFGGSTVRRITETATPIVKTFCNRCADDYYRRCKEEAEKRSLKGLFKRVFKKNK